MHAQAMFTEECAACWSLRLKAQRVRDHARAGYVRRGMCCVLVPLSERTAPAQSRTRRLCSQRNVLRAGPFAWPLQPVVGECPCRHQNICWRHYKEHSVAGLGRSLWDGKTPHEQEHWHRCQRARMAIVRRSAMVQRGTVTRDVVFQNVIGGSSTQGIAASAAGNADT